MKLTEAPARVGEDDVARLRDHGFEEAAILDICQVTAYYNYVNRLADGLGVEMEASWKAEELTMTAAEFEARAGHRPSAPPAGGAPEEEPSRGEHAPPPLEGGG